jgi:predicted enzyme related to lactoylglutathione lyase
MNKYRILSFVLIAAGIAACTTSSKPDLSGMTFADDPLIGKVIWHDLITEDLDGAKRFYGGMFDWTFEDTKAPSGQDYSVARSGNVYVAGMVTIESPADGSNYSRWLPYISVADVDAAMTLVTAAGGTVAATARDVNLGRVAALIDPEGAVIGLARSKFGDPDDRTTAAGPGRPMWTELLSDDAESAIGFYQALVGYDLRVLERRGGQYNLLGGNGVDRVGVMQNPSEDVSPVWLTYFGVTDPAAAAEKAESLGGRIILPPSPEFRNGTLAVVADPSGAILVLQNWSNFGGEE